MALGAAAKVPLTSPTLEKIMEFFKNHFVPAFNI